MEIAVGVLLALAGLVLVGLVAAFVTARRTGSPTDSRTVESVDDLPDFLEHPPGSVAPGGPADRVATGGSVALWSPVRPATAFPPAVPARTLGALAGLVVLLLVAAVVVASLAGAGGRDEGARGAPREAAPAGAEARLRFGGIVLEERAVGVTVSYPELTLGADADGQVAALELPTWNCLAVEAPEDPADAGCTPGRTEYAELHSPDLVVTHDEDDLRIAGAFPTTTRPTGGEPEPTGRTYDLVVTVGLDDTSSGELELGDRRTSLVEGDLRIHE